MGVSYNVGDEVVVRDDLVEGHSYNGIVFNAGMSKFKGKKAKVDEVVDVFGRTRYSINIDNGWYWSGDMFERDFKKSDLKAGMIVQLNTGLKYLVLQKAEGCLFLTSDRDYVSSLYNYNENLIHTNHKELSINAVYEPCAASPIKQIPNEENLKLIWQRKDELDEVIKLFAEHFDVKPEDVEVSGKHMWIKEK